MSKEEDEVDVLLVEMECNVEFDKYYKCLQAANPNLNKEDLAFFEKMLRNAFVHGYATGKINAFNQAAKIIREKESENP